VPVPCLYIFIIQLNMSKLGIGSYQLLIFWVYNLWVQCKVSKVVSQVNIDLLSASHSKQTSNALKRSLVIWDHTVLPATWQRWFSRLYSLAFTSTHFTVPWRVEGWVDLGTEGKVQQPMPKTAYHSSCRDKRTDGGFSPAARYTRTRPLRPARPIGVNNLASVTTRQC